MRPHRKRRAAPAANGAAAWGSGLQPKKRKNRSHIVHSTDRSKFGRAGIRWTLNPRERRLSSKWEASGGGQKGSVVPYLSGRRTAFACRSREKGGQKMPRANVLELTGEEKRGRLEWGSEGGDQNF